MSATFQRAFEVMLEASFSATILALIIAAVQWALRGRLSPAWRFALWTPVLLRLFLPVFPESSFSLFNAPRWYANWTGAADRAPVKPQFVEPLELAAFDDAAVVDLRAAPGAAPLTQAPNASAVALTGETIRSAAVVIWTFGALLFLARLAIGSFWLSWRTRKAASTANSHLNDILRETAQTIGCASQPRLKETTLVESPALFGLWRPVLLLPLGFSERLSETEVRHVFLHELAHLKRRDLLLNWLMALAQALHWFNPVVWLVFRRMRLERELACDEMALLASQGSDPKAYGETILRLLEGVSTRRALSALVGIAEEKHSAKQRLRQIASFRGGKRKYWIGLFVLVGLVLVGLTNAQAPKKAGDAAPDSPEQNAETTERSSFQKDEAVIRFDALQVEGKTLTEALQILRTQYPDELRDVRFTWYQSTNITSGPGGTYSANAVGYITSEIGKLATPADDLRLSREALSRNPRIGLGPVAFASGAKLEIGGQVSSALEVIVRAIEERVLCRIQEDTVTFSLEPTSHDRVVALIQDGRILMEMGRLPEATSKLDEALKIEPDSRAAKYYLELAHARAIAQQAARDRDRAAKFIHPVITNITTVSRDVLQYGSSDPSKQIGFDWYSGNVLIAKDKASLSDTDRTNRSNVADPRLRNAVPGVISVTDYQVGSESVLFKIPVEDNGADATAGLPDDPPRFSNGLRYDHNPKQVEFVFANPASELPRQSNAPIERGPATGASLPPNPFARTNRVHTSAGRQAIVKKLNEVVFPVYDVADLPLKDVIKDLSHTARQRDPDKVGVNFIFSSLTQAVEASSPNRFQDAPRVDDFLITISPPLRNVRLVDLLNAITHVAVPPEGADPSLRLRYSIEDYAVVFSYGAEEPEPLYTRSYRVDPNTFVHGLDKVYYSQGSFGFRQTAGQGGGGGGIIGVTTTNSMTEIQEAVRNFFGAAGIDFSTNNQSQPPANGTPLPPQKAIYFNHTKGILLVRATLREMDIVENALQLLNKTPPQIMLETQAIMLRRNEEIGIIAGMLRLIQKGNFRPALTQAEFRKFRVDQPFLSAERITTVSGRPATLTVDEDCVLVVQPFYSEQDATLRIVATRPEAGEKRPAFTRQGTIYDGQTFVVMPNRDDPTPKYIVFITATLIDPAGNRIADQKQNAVVEDRTPPQDEK